MTILPGLLVGTVVHGDDAGPGQGRSADAAVARASRSPADLFNTVGLDDWLAAAQRYSTD